MPSDRKQYSKTRPIALKEFDLEKAWWANLQETEYAWRASLDEIKARNYNLAIKNSHQKADDLGDPVHRLSHYEEHLRLIAEQRDALKEELAEALLR